MNASHKTAIQFKDLYIPVKMQKVSRDSSIELNQLCKESKERVRYKKYCPSCDKEITNKDIVKGYCYTTSPERYVTLTDEDIQAITTDKEKTLHIKYFCKPKEISDLLIDKSYYLIPEMEAEIEYVLLRKAMLSNKVAGIAEIVLGTKQELVALFPNEDCIVATILFYENEMNEMPELFPHKLQKDRLENVKASVLACTRAFEWSAHFDKYQLKLRELILKKIPK
uniref:non-homologous end joining protein Ku n=1 Tax=Agathobacter sp. TaxID=2021311 RepID=UPI0040562A34